LLPWEGIAETADGAWSNLAAIALKLKLPDKMQSEVHSLQAAKCARPCGYTGDFAFPDPVN